MLIKYIQLALLKCMFSLTNHRISDVIVSVVVSRAVDRWIKHRSGQSKDYKIGMFFFSSKHKSLRRTTKEWLGREQDNVPELSDMSILGLLFQCAGAKK
jgi:hypothetical protein